MSMRSPRTACAAALCLLAAAAPLGAQVITPQPAARDTLRDDRAFDFYAGGPFRAAVPRPEALLGYPIGSWHTQYASQERVLLAIAEAAKDRVVVEQIGVTAEKRSMRAFIVSSPANIARLDAIRADLDALADPRGKSATELAALAARTPAVVMFSMSVHGDEVPGFEAAMPLLYQWAASEDPAVLAALERTIIVLNPSSNPDGHERFSVWSNAIAVGSPEPGGLEQQRSQPWSISGRFNHYRFDMNRDVFASTQREVQAIVRTIHRWHAMVHADLHGYTDPYYFAPPARPVNARVGANTVQWLDRIGAGNAAAFDRYGWAYYVRDVFDLFYPGYWDTWPSLTGAAGTTYETDGGPALLKRRDDGTYLSLRDGIAKHFTAAMATWRTTADAAPERVRDYAAFRQAAVEDGRTQRLKRVVWTDGNDPRRAAELAAMLLRNGIEVRRTEAAFTSAKAQRYADGKAGTQRFEPGAYVVDLAQPLGRLATSLLELDPPLDSAFAASQREKFARNQERGPRGVREGYEFYDVTAWSLPVAFGVDAWWTEDAPNVSGPLLSLPAAPAYGEALPVEIRGGVVRGAGATSAYLFSNERQSASRLAAALLLEDIRVSISSEPLDVGGEAWPRGTYVARVARNLPSLHARIDALAREAGVEVVGVNTAFPVSGQYSTGSGPVATLQTPRVALVGGDGVDHTAYGALWWTLDQRYRIPFTPISTDALGGDLSRYTVIIVPSASAGALGNGAALRSWVQGGGTLILTGGAAAWAARESVNLTSARAVTPDTSGGNKPAAPATLASDTTMGVRSPGAQPDAPASLPGSLFDVVLDRTHWLTLGMDQRRLTVLMQGSTFLRPSKEASNVAVFAPDGALHRAGFLWPENSERLLRGTAAVIEEPLGRGHVVLFNTNPVFRGWWRSLDKLLLNAVLLGSGF
jgi:hypothetical protein